MGASVRSWRSQLITRAAALPDVGRVCDKCSRTPKEPIGEDWLSLDPRRFLRSLFDAGVAAGDPQRCVPPHLPSRPRGRLVVVGAGKAAAAMAAAVESHYGGALEGLVVTRYGHAVPCRQIE